MIGPDSGVVAGPDSGVVAGPAVVVGPDSGVVAGPAVVVISKERRETSVAKHFIATSDRVPHVLDNGSLQKDSILWMEHGGQA